MGDNRYYEKDFLFKQVKKAIVDKKLFRFLHIPPFVGVANKTIDRYFPNGTKEREKIEELLANNRITSAKKIENKWENSDDFRGQLAFYKLVCDDESLVRLSKSSIDHTTNGKEIQPFHFKVIDGNTPQNADDDTPNP